ncbi:hypothetical protein [Pseudoxanthomonas suwonensis]|uniref:Secreted protein n=1 Tax=Pseudoxanthomonas suwonensis TaxID=314722 RepID=A0A0E3UNG6_9GAMM|nr:hypothetical protein [Pseudoxanthomonas suwonensis]AKC86940.1 hypothetical protein WQ53_09430 [Pseudoxanthomonas suwonensis]
MRCLLLSLLWSFALPLAAQQPTHACAGVAEPAARLACYDGAFPPPPEVVEAATDKAQADFGLNKPRDLLCNPGQIIEQADLGRIESQVVKVGHYNGQRVFSLENGQVWTQAESHSGGHVQAGDVEQVRKGMLGGCMLVMPNGVALHVRRTH